MTDRKVAQFLEMAQRHLEANEDVVYIDAIDLIDLCQYTQALRSELDYTQSQLQTQRWDVGIGHGAG